MQVFQFIPGDYRDTVWQAFEGVALTALLFIPLERLLPMTKQKLVRKAFFQDWGWFFINVLVTPVLMSAAILALVGVLRYVAPFQLIAWMESRPLWFLLPASLLVGEIGYYWGHRLAHEIPWLWRFHAIHHSAEELDWLVNSKVHPVDVLFTRLCKMLPLLVLGLSRPLHGHAPWLLFAIAEVSNVWTYFTHANVKWRLRWLDRIVSTPAFHHWHHSNDFVPNSNRNYASLFPVVDVIFGSYFLPEHLPEQYGISERLPQSMARQFVQPILGLFGGRLQH